MSYHLIIDLRIVYRLLAVGGELVQTEPYITVPVNPNNPRPIGPRERSISAPNVNLVNLNQKHAEVRTTGYLSLSFALRPVFIFFFYIVTLGILTQYF